MTENQLVSVIVPTKNSEATIEKCLRSIRNQSYPKVEIIVVDSFSGDKTREIAENYGARIILAQAKRSEARNKGVEKAGGGFVFFADSDMELDFSVIAECVNKIREGSGATIIPEVSVGEGFWAKCKALEKTCYIGDDAIEAARFLKRSIFESISGYDPVLEAGEDWDLNQRIRKAGYSIGRTNAFIRHHEEKLTLRKTVLKKRNYGKTLKYYKMKHPKEASMQLRLIRPSFMANWRKLAKDPAHAFGMFFMKTCEFIAGWIGSVEL